ncbi:protein spartin isoform X2 [Chrysoperla carnea]|uniref:protein spartin isoform X2 n=1 Tax=Chrysoperla carnea TaxID=189513 RepID=UPI001D07FED1|nr:protein spartin isoform X2 [Chrysoperla carnea]
MGNSRSKSDGDEDCGWVKTYKEIKTNHDEAYRCIDCAITLEEEERKNEALEKYKLGISIIDKVLNIHVECPEKTDETWVEACGMIQKMKRTRAEIIKRIASIQSSTEQQPSTSGTVATKVATPADPPPSYEEAVSESSSATPHTYSELASALENLKIEPTATDTRELALVYAQDNVRVYFISPDGTVVSFNNLETLNIYVAVGEKKNPNDPDGFMEINEWIYPLIPAVSPCFKSEFGALIVPDTNAPATGSAIGIVLPPDADIEALLSLLDDIIHGVVSADIPVLPIPYSAAPKSRSRRELPRNPFYSNTISNGIVNGAWYMREGLIKGAQAAGSLISYGTPKLLTKIRPAEEPTPINPKLTKGLNTAKNVTGAAVSVTGFVAGKVGSATMALGRYLAPHIQKQGTKLLTTKFNMDEDSAHLKVDGVLNVAAGAVEGLATVYSGLEQSSKILGESITHNTVKIVEHKYGPDAGELTEDSIYTMGNVYNFTNSMKFFKPSSLAKSTAKGAGKGFLTEFKEHHLLTHDGYTIPDLTSFSAHVQNLHANAPNSNGSPAPSTSLEKN